MNSTGWIGIARAVHLTACLLLLGLVYSKWVVFRERRIVSRQLITTLWIIGTLAGIGWFLAVSREMLDVPWRDALTTVNLHLIWTQTHFGRLCEIRAILLAGCLVAAWWPDSFMQRMSMMISCAGLVASLAWAGHGQAGRWPAVHLAADVGHLLATAVWPIGLLPLVFALSQNQYSAAAVRRFSAGSVAAVGILSITGIINAAALLAAPSELWRSRYGQLLLTKVVLFAGMTGLGAVNLLSHKRLNAAVGAGAATAMARLRRNIWLEIGLGSGVLIIVALLGVLAPGFE